ncbi:MAG: phasin family protein [Alphaproteobacteria bacterium]|nr:phasin family protein [Alphaproteobacteria bacterium]
MPSPFDNWLKPEFLSNFSPTSSASGMGGVKSLMESGRKSIQACAEAQQIAMESMQTIIQRQTEILSQIAQENSAIAQEIINEGTPEEKIARGAELIRSAYEKTVSGMQEVGDICNKSTKEACDIINRRVTACLDEVQCTAKASAGKTKKAAGKKSA